MADPATSRERRKLLRAQLRLSALLLTGIAVLCTLHFGIARAGLNWNGWVVGIVALLVSATAWVVTGFRPGGWVPASVVTWVAHVVCTTALFMWGELGVASIAAGLIYGSIWAGALLVPVALVSTIVRDTY
ncbi:MAG: hypothetical protein GX596_09920 [Propionibacterium sp.]|nr:hypothetical protein [Propionibacterium sp.]